MKNGIYFLNADNKYIQPDTSHPKSHHKTATVTRVQNQHNRIAGNTFQVSKTGPAKMMRGSTVNYVITANNLGPADEANATISDVIPTVLTGVTWQAIALGGAKITGNTSGSGNVSVLANLPVTNDGGVQVIITGTVMQSAPSNTITNVAQVSASGSSTATSTPVNSQIGSLANLAISKTAPINVAIGNAISYQLEVTNSGPSDADNAVITDSIPLSLQQVATTVTSMNGGAGNIQLNTVSGTMQALIGTFPAGAKAVITITAITTEIGTIRNTANIKPPANVTDPDLDNNHCTAVTEVTK